MRAFARFGLPDGTTAELGHGDIIGRLWSAALCLDDPRVSEAHAMVSLRDHALKLLALRGRFALDGQPGTEAVLVPGLRIELAPGLAVTVESVQVPEDVLALEADGLPRQILGGVCSIIARPRPTLRPGYVGSADAWIWSTGEGWQLRIDGGRSRPLLADDSFTLDDTTFRAVSTRLEQAPRGVTVVKGGIISPLRIEAYLDTVHIHRADRETVAISGMPARIVSELVAFDGPVAWELLAREVWGEAGDRTALRRKLDVSLARLRRKLRDARVRPDLVRAAGTGHLELLLHERDEVVDQM